MANVNPPPLRIPKAVLADPETAGFFLELITVIRQLWLRTGGGSDIINNTTNFSAQTTIGGISFDQRADELDRRIARLSAAMMAINDDALKLAVVCCAKP